MAAIEYWYDQDLKKPVKIRVMDGCAFTQDNIGTLIGVKVYDNGEPVTLTGTVNGYCILPDGTTAPISGTRSGNTAYIKLTQGVLAYSGSMRITIKLTNGNEITTLLAVFVTVSLSKTDTVITPSSQVIEDWSQEISESLQAVGEEVTNLNGEVSDLKSVIDAVTLPKYANDFSWTVGRSIDGTGTIKATDGFAITSNFVVSPGTAVLNRTTDKGYNEKTTAFWVHEYDDTSTWLRRTQVNANTTHAVGNDCVSIRIAYGYPMNQSVTITEQMIADYFAASIYEEAGLKKANGYVRILTSTDDLDNLENGVYGITKSSLPAGCPLNKGGILQQVGQISHLRTSQTIWFDNGISMYRNKAINKGWMQWEFVANASDVKSLLFDNQDQIVSLHKSDGQLYELPITGTEEFVRYKENGGVISEQDIGEYGTAYIKCPKYLVIAFGLADVDARLMVYFYTKSGNTYAPRWDILNLTTETGVKNYFGSGSSVNRVVSIPDDTYMRVSNPVVGDVTLYGWTGEHFGPEVCGYGLTPDEGDSYQLVSAVESGFSGLVIPGSVGLVCMKDMAISNVWGVKGDTKTKIATSKRQAVPLPSGYDYFIARINYATLAIDSAIWTNSKTVTYADLNDSISMLANSNVEKPYGRATGLIERAKKILGIEWTCLNTNLSVSNSSQKFKYNSVYKGTPYMSRWTKACYLGWHISAHTFVNAANDVRSVFYKETGRNGGPGYGLVCSSFATLVAGWPYPVVNAGFPRDPKCKEIKVNKPQIGMIMTKNMDHCFVPETFGYGDGYNEYTLYEQSAPMLRRTGNYDFITNMSAASRNYSYLDEYIYAVEHDDSINAFNGTYDIDDVTVVGGAARPYRGDRCVYTSNDVVKINIKDSTATTCYYQACTYDALTDTFTLTGITKSATVMTDDSYYVNIDKTTLTDGFWAVWTNTDNTKEYFEYHTAPECTYSLTNTTISFDVPGDEFWYAVWWEDDVPSGITEIVPYLPDGDYSGYRKVYNPNGEDGYMFFKGTLGAYVVPVMYRG